MHFLGNACCPTIAMVVSSHDAQASGECFNHPKVIGSICIAPVELRGSRLRLQPAPDLISSHSRSG